MEPKEFVKEYSIKSLVSCFSGGKDSLVTTHYVLRNLEDVEDLDRYVVHVDTSVSLPGVQDYVKEICDVHGWNLVILKPKVDFWTLAEKWGMPSFRRRWCCYHLKLEPLREFIKGLRPQRAEVLGLRISENPRRRSRLVRRFVLRDKQASAWLYSPLLEWTDKQVYQYIRKEKLSLNPIYSLIGKSGECICGAFTTKKQLEIIRGNFPDFFQQFVDLEKQFRSKATAFYKSGKCLRAEDFLKQKTLSEACEAHDS